MATTGDERTADLSLDTPVTYFKEVEGRELLTPERELALGKKIREGRQKILDKSLEIMRSVKDTTVTCERIENWLEDSHKSPLSVEDIMFEAKDGVAYSARKLRKNQEAGQASAGDRARPGRCGGSHPGDG